MGVRLVADGARFAVEAPVALNSNHLQTAFGGSINAVATLAGYAFLWLEVHDVPAHVVIRDSTIRFLRPVRETLRATCVAPATDALAEFHRRLTNNGKAAIELHVEVKEHGLLAAEFVATFVARRE